MTDLEIYFRRIVVVAEFWVVKPLEYSELSAIFFEILENNKDESKLDDGGLSCKVSEGTKVSMRFIL